MINFEQELLKFSPILEIEEIEDNIESNEIADIFDIIREITNEKKN